MSDNNSEQPPNGSDDSRTDSPKVHEVEIVEAEVVAAPRRRLADDTEGRVFDADGRLERGQWQRAGSGRAPGGVQFEGEVRTGCGGAIGRWMGRFFGLLAVGALAIAFLAAGGFTLDGAVQWAQANPVLARGGIVVFITAMLPLLLPTGPVAVVPGYLWGETQGLLLVLAGACLGGVLNMFLARRFVGQRVDAFVRATPGLAALRNVIDARGFRIALALRLSPVTPYALVSYMAGLTGISYGRYALASLLGGVPWTLVYATAGSLLAAQSKTVTLDADVGPAGPWLRLVGLAFTVIVAVWIGRAARQELAAARQQMG